MDNIIDLENISKVYKLYSEKKDRIKEVFNINRKKYHVDFFAIKNISLKIKKGEIVGFIGKNGAGKSTLLKLITGILTPTLGKIDIKGKISALIELGAGFNPEYTGMENIYLYGTLMGYERVDMEKKVNTILEFADIGNFINQPVKNYSSGMFARLAFSCAINVEPEILIVDEILSVGDLVFQLKCIEKMKQMMEKGVTVIFVSHDINTIKRFCNRAVWLKDGEIKLDGDINYVTDKYLDFLRYKDHGSNEKKEKEKINFENNIAVLKEFKIYNYKFEEVESFSKNEKIIIEIIYEVMNEEIKDPVLGIAIGRNDNEYICGLNTMLDKVKISWNYGINKMYLEYDLGILVSGGTYYFDCALFERTSTIPIEFRSRIKKFFIQSNYDFEGSFLIPHKWYNAYECEEIL